ncbi:hypothetical protein H0H87_011905 [Tephrocybe sp. NHM501043]|nr:hypothetical protein H0H87_011905 [Tephrocybe sp. NHM501043]
MSKVEGATQGHFPDELQHLIFQTAARADETTVRQLVLVARHVRTWSRSIFANATLYAFGWKLPPDADHSVIYEPMSKLSGVDSDASDMHNFHAWVSSYYDQPESPKSVNNLDFAERTEHASSDNWSTDELESFHEYDAFV